MIKDIHSEYSGKIVDPTTPWITIFLLLLCFLAFCLSALSGKNWLSENAFTGARLTAALQNHNTIQILTTLTWPSFCQFNAWQLLGNLYFLWIFGSMVESRLGNIRFLILVLICQILGWLIIYLEFGGGSDTMFIGSSLLAASIVGAYMNFLPERKINLIGSISRNYLLARHQPQASPIEAFSISPGLLIATYLAFQIIIQVAFSMLSIHFDTISLISGIGSGILGLIICWAMVNQLTPKAKGGPLKRLTIKKYRELLALDMSKDQSIKGASRLLGVPEEQARQWTQHKESS